MRGIPHSQEIYNGREYLFDASGFPRLIFKVITTEGAINDGCFSDLSVGGYKYLGHDKWLFPRAEKIQSWAYPGEWKKYIKLCREIVFNNRTRQLTLVCRKDEGMVGNEDVLCVYPRGFYLITHLPFVAKLRSMDPDHTFLWKSCEKSMGAVLHNEIVLTRDLPRYVRNKALSVGIGKTTREE